MRIREYRFFLCYGCSGCQYVGTLTIVEMSPMKRIITFALILLVSLLGLTFALMNAETVQLNYYFGDIHAPLSLVVVIAIIIGAGLGVLASMGIVFGQKRELAKLRKSARLAEQEVSNLRSLPLKDNH